MEKYILMTNGYVRNIETNEVIPNDPSNADYMAYILWMQGRDSMGNVISKERKPTKEEENLDSLKLSKIADLKATAEMLLKETDWYVIRSIETTKGVPPNIINRRKAIRAYVSKAEKEISSIKTLTSVNSYIFKFPM